VGRGLRASGEGVGSASRMEGLEIAEDFLVRLARGAWEVRELAALKRRP
jgi:hypothetical protein